MKYLVVIAVAFIAQSAVASYYGGYYGPAAAPVVTPSGFLADTPEVAAAKSAHLALVAKAGGAGYSGAGYAGAGYAGAGYAGARAGAYQGPLAAPVVTPSGFLADTPEVAAAKAAHLNLVARAGQAGAYSGAYYAGAQYNNGQYNNGQYNNGQYNGQYDDGQYDDGQYDDGQYNNGQYNNGQYNNGQYNAYAGQYAGQYGGQYGANNEGQYVRDKNNW